MPTDAAVYKTALESAECFTDETVKSQLLGEITKFYIKTGKIDDALAAVQKIPGVYERKVILLGWDWKDFPANSIGKLVTVLESNAQTKTLAGRLAISMLESEKPDEAWKLIEIAALPFETENQRYEFFQKFLSAGKQPVSDESLNRFIAGFKDETYRQWSLYLLAKFFIAQKRYGEGEKIADAFTSPLHRSWTYEQFSLLCPPESGLNYLKKSAEILDSVTLSSDTVFSGEREKQSIQFRIIGKKCCQNKLFELGESLLEKSESAASASTPPERYRLQCFLAEVLRELKLIDAIETYLPVKQMLQEPLSALERSRLLEYLGEASGQSGYYRQAITAACAGERGTSESECAERITEILNHYADEKSREEAEADVFSPFASTDCGC